MCLLQFCISLGMDLWTGDCKSAFLQGMDITGGGDRPDRIYMRAPVDPIAKEAIEEWRLGAIYELLSGVYGLAQAPRMWFAEFRRRLVEMKFRPHSLDPCLFLHFVDGVCICLVGVHVDDVLIAIEKSLRGENLRQKIYEKFEWGSEWSKDDFIFCGRRICLDREKQVIRLSQEHYVHDLQLINLRGYLDEEPLQKYPALVTEFRSGIGSLQWLAGMSRPDVCADTSLLQRPIPELTIRDLRDVHATLRYVRATAAACVVIKKVDLSRALLVPYGDASWANAPGARSQAGMILCLCDKDVLDQEGSGSILDWKSTRLKRVCRSTLAAEAASCDVAVDHAMFYSYLLSELLDEEFIATLGVCGMIEIAPTTDCRSLFDAVRRLATSFQEKRVQIDVTSIRESSSKSIRWVPTTVQRADGLTKRSTQLRNELRAFCENPRITLKDAPGPDDTDDANPANRPSSR